MRLQTRIWRFVPAGFAVIRRPVYAPFARQLCPTPRQQSMGMKRKALDSQTLRTAKRQKEPEPDYCDVPTQKDSNGVEIWPAAANAIVNARTFIREW